MNKLRLIIIRILLKRVEREALEEAVASHTDYISYQRTFECDIYSNQSLDIDQDVLDKLSVILKPNLDRDYFLKSFSSKSFIDNAKAKFLR